MQGSNQQKWRGFNLQTQRLSLNQLIRNAAAQGKEKWLPKPRLPSPGSRCGMSYYRLQKESKIWELIHQLYLEVQF